jgi:hypothetical protein
MAVSGSGSPSFGVILNRRRLQSVGYTQNKPKEVILSAEEVFECLKLQPMQIVQLDAHYPNFLRLWEMLLAEELIDDETK